MGRISSLSVRTCACVLFALAGCLAARPVDATPLFRAPFIAIPMGGFGDFVTSADLDGDGKPDLITSTRYPDVNQKPGGVRVARGTGGGEFATPLTYAPSLDSSRPAIAELTGDGHLDLATADYQDGHVYILPGLGDGSFGAAIPIDIGSQCYTVAAADLDLDGHADIIASSWTSVAVRLSTGGSTYAPVVTYPTATNTSFIAIGLLNADPYPDIVTAGEYASTVSVLLGAGNGTFQPALSLATNGSASDLVVTDVTGDGKTDIVVGVMGGSVELFAGDGTGGFEARQDFALANMTGRLAVADVNSDGHPDLLVGVGSGSGSEGALTVLFGNGLGGFPTRLTVLSLSALNGVWAGDLDGDGHPDLVAAGALGIVALHSGNGATFGSALRYTTGSDPIANALGDLDGDGLADLVVAQHGAPSVAVWRGAGDGTFGIRRDQELGIYPPQAVAVGDLDGDGHADVVVADSWETGSSAFGHVWVLRGYSGGTFVSTTETTMGVRLSGVAIGDLDENHGNDVVVSDRLANRVSVLLNSGNGSLLPPSHYGAGDGASGIALGDLDADGHLDVAVANRTAGTVTVLFGDGHGTFVRQTDLPAGAGCRSVAIGQLDGDAVPDLVTANELDGSVAILRGLGGGAFDLPMVTPVGTSPISVAIANLNPDGQADLVIGFGADPSSPPGYPYGPAPINTVGVLIGMGAGVFQPLRLFGAGSTPQQVAFADLDGNGSIDLVTADRTSNSVTVLLNNSSTVSVGAGRPVTDLRVGPTFPNPAPASVTIPFAMVREGSARIRIYDAEGRVVRTLVDGTLGAGEHLASWDRRTEAGTRAGAGIYFYEFRASGHVANGRFVLL